MDAWVEVREGARAGDMHRLGGEPVVVGRHGDAQVRLDPDADLSVSGRHALLTPTSTGWTVRDLGSTNGTWVNDERLTGDLALSDGDRIRLGPGGPLLIFRIGAPATVTVRSPSGKWLASRRARWVAAAAAVLVLSALGYLAGRHVTRRAWDEERAALEARMDSVLALAQTRTAALVARDDSLRRQSADRDSLQLRVSGLLESLQRSEGEVRSLRTSLREAKNGRLDDAEVARLQQRLQAVSVALERQQLAASLDFGAIEHATRPGIAQIYVQTAEGVATGTAFGVAPTGILMTNRHVVTGPDGTARPTRIGVQFADSRQVWPAHIVAVSRTSDLALVQVERLEGTIPTVLGFDTRVDTLGPGSPVAMIGFPLGGRAPDAKGGVIRPLLTAGVLTGTRDGLLVLQGYGDKGASGSPVVDRDGHVVGVLVGGRQDEGERTLYAVPAHAALRLLQDNQD